MSCYIIKPLSDHVALFGESPFWDDQTQSFVYADCHSKAICSFDWSSKKTRVIPVDTPAEFIMVVTPIASSILGEDNFLVVSKNEILIVNSNPVTGENSTKVIYNANKGRRFMFEDGKCDTMGRLWVGETYVDSFEPIIVGPEKGQLCCYTEESGHPIPHSTNYDISNGLTWNADSTKLFSADCFRQTVNVFDFDVSAGTLGPQSVLFDFKTTTHPELKKIGPKNFPDGLAMDLNGNLWLANWANGMVVKVDGTTGTVLDIVYIPVTHVTSLAFGGPTHQSLLVTTTSLDLESKKCQEGNPDAGKIHEITCERDNGFRGFKMNRFGPLTKQIF